MKPTKTNSTSFYPRVVATIVAVMFCLLTPLAAAANWGPLGDIRGDNVSAAAVFIGALGILAVILFWTGVIHRPGAAVLGGVVAVVVVMSLLLYNPSAGGAPKAATILGNQQQTTAAAAATGSGNLQWDPTLYERTSQLTFSAVDANPANHAAISPTYDLFCMPADSASGLCPSATTEEQAVIGSGSPVSGGSGLTMTNGASTAAVNWYASSYGCGLLVHFDLANYYESLQSVPTPDGTTACAPLRAGTSVTAIPIPAFQMKKEGTFTETQVGGGSTLTCSAGSDCVFSLQVGTSVAGTYLEHVAAKVGTLVNATINSIDATTASVCHIETGVQGTDTIIVIDQNGGEVDPAHTAQCNVHISRSSGSSGGSFQFTADDLYKQYEATEFVTNSNIRNAAASSTLTITFA